MDPDDAAAVRPSRLVALLAAGGALALLAGAVLTLRGVDVSEQATRLVSVADGTLLVDADGNRTPALVGGTVPLGSTVRAAFEGTVLETGDREVVLAAGTAVSVLDGARQRLEEGALLVDALDASGLQITSGAADVQVPDDAVVRVERAPVLRVATYAGSAEVRAPGRRTGREVPRLQQVQVPDGALPGRPLPLVLTVQDAWEAERLPEVVLEDTALRSLASTLSGTASASAARVRADLATVVPTLAAVSATPVETGERSVAHALAHVDGAYSAEAFTDVRRLRGLGGSWGVVAALSGTSLADAEAYLDGLLPSAPVQALGPASGSAGALGSVLGLPGLVGPGSTSPSTPRGTTPRPVRAPVPVDGPAPAPAPRPSPGSGGLQAILDSVLDLLPVPVAAAPSAPAAVPPAPAATRAPASAPAPAAPAPRPTAASSPAPAPAPVELPAPLPALPLPPVTLPPVKSPVVKLPMHGSATATVGTSSLLDVPAPLR